MPIKMVFHEVEEFPINIEHTMYVPRKSTEPALAEQVVHPQTQLEQLMIESKEECKDQELIQSSTTPDP